jgi:predicted nucleic acid-binding Zn ribbon protein
MGSGKHPAKGRPGVDMHTGTPASEISAEAARALQGAIPLSSCPACGKPLTRRQRACSGRCRAILSRRRYDRAREAGDQKLRQLLKAALRMLES